MLVFEEGGSLRADSQNNAHASGDSRENEPACQRSARREGELTGPPAQARKEEKRSTRGNPQSKDENQQQTQPTYRSQLESNQGHILVKGKGFHHCVIPAPNTVYLLE